MSWTPNREALVRAGLGRAVTVVIMDHYAVCLGDSHVASFDPVGEGGRGGGKFYDGLESHTKRRLVGILALTLCCRH